MKLFWPGIVLLALMGVWGCEATPYQRAGLSSKRGFSETRLSEDTFHVVFRANYTTSVQTLREYLYRRAAELTLEHGFRYFAVVRPARPLTQYRTEYRSQEDEEAMTDSMEAEYPAWGTMHMTIQCFREGEQPADGPLIDAQAHLAGGDNSRPQ